MYENLIKRLEALGIMDALDVDKATNRTTLQNQAKTAITSNTNYLALDPPTTAQALAQVRTLTVQVNKIIKLVVNELDSTD